VSLSERIAGVRIVPAHEFLRATGDRQEIERAFFAGLLMRNGVYKTTAAHRMDDLLPPLVASARTLTQPVRILDVACSSGVSTLEMHQAMLDAGIAAETVGTDLALHAQYSRRDDGGGAMVFNSAGQVIQVEIGNWASPWRWRPRDLALRPFTVLRARRMVARESDDFRQGRGSTVERFDLLSTRTRDVPGLSFDEEDILAPRVPGPFGVIRAANLLNPSYFADRQLAAMIAALRARLAPGGLLLVARTDAAGVNRATIFRESSGRLAVEARANGGSEIERLVA